MIILDIIQCVPYFFPSEGGTERTVLYLSKELVRLGHNVKIFAFNAFLNSKWKIEANCNEGMSSFEVIEGLKVFRFNYSCLGPTGTRLSVPLFKSLVKTKTDIVHLQGFFHFPNLFMEIIGSKYLNAPTVLTVHGLNETMAMLNSCPPLLKYPIKTFLKLGLNGVSRFIALTKNDKHVLSYLGVDSLKIHYIPNGVNIDLYENSNVNLSVFEKYGIPNSRIVLCVSRVARNKGLHTLMVAASTLIKNYRNLNFVIVGRRNDWEYYTELRVMIDRLGLSENIFFLENIPDEDLISLYKFSQVFVLPSEEETLPLVIFEAMAAGCPIIATKVGGIPEIIDDRKSGILVAPNNPQELLKWISVLLSDENLRLRLIEVAKKIIYLYSWTEIAERTLDVYHSLLSK